MVLGEDSRVPWTARRANQSEREEKERERKDQREGKRPERWEGAAGREIQSRERSKTMKERDIDTQRLDPSLPGLGIWGKPGITLPC